MKEVTSIEELGKVKKIVYVAAVLTPASKHKLLEWVQTKDPLHSEVKCHHCTLTFSPSKEYIQDMPLGEKVSIDVIGYAHDSKAQAVAVKLSVKCANKVPHITVSHTDDTKPVYSNDLLEKGYESVEGPELEGHIVAFCN